MVQAANESMMKAFREFDTDGDKSLDMQEFFMMMHEAGASNEYEALASFGDNLMQVR